MIVWTPAVLSVLYAHVFYFCICPCSAQLSMFHMKRRSRNMLIIINSEEEEVSSCPSLGFSLSLARILSNQVNKLTIIIVR